MSVLKDKLLMTTGTPVRLATRVTPLLGFRLVKAVLVCLIC